MNYQDILFVTVLLVVAGAFRALHVSYRSHTLKLLEVCASPDPPLLLTSVPLLGRATISMYNSNLFKFVNQSG
jgi:hypothetical protein